MMMDCGCGFGQWFQFRKPMVQWKWSHFDRWLTHCHSKHHIHSSQKFVGRNLKKWKSSTKIRYKIRRGYFGIWSQKSPNSQWIWWTPMKMRDLVIRWFLPRIQAKVDLGFATMVSQLKHLHAVPRSALGLKGTISYRYDGTVDWPHHEKKVPVQIFSEVHIIQGGIRYFLVGASFLQWYHTTGD